MTESNPTEKVGVVFDIHSEGRPVSWIERAVMLEEEMEKLLEYVEQTGGWCETLNPEESRAGMGRKFSFGYAIGVSAADRKIIETEGFDEWKRKALEAVGEEKGKKPVGFQPAGQKPVETSTEPTSQAMMRMSEPRQPTPKGSHIVEVAHFPRDGGYEVLASETLEGSVRLAKNGAPS